MLYLFSCRLVCFFVVLFAIVAPRNLHAQQLGDRPVGLPTTSPASLGMDEAALNRIDPLIEEAIEEGNTAGAVVLIGYRGSIVFHRTYGHRALEPQSLPMEKDTVFDLASLTKPIATATSIMMLVDEGKLHWQDRVVDHLPAFNNNGKDQLTIEQLLIHTAGLIPDNALADYEESPEKAVENLMNIKLSYEPGEDFRYSDVGFLVLGEIVRAKTGLDVHQYSQQKIFQPLEMRETGYVPTESLRARAAVTEKRGDAWIQGEVHDPRAYLLGGIAGHAGLFSTASDLAIYAQMMVQRGTYDQQQFLRPETFAAMTAAYEVPRGKRGFGWDKRSGFSSNRGATMTDAAFGHGGFTGTAIWIDPELELFVIFLSNRLHPDGKGNVNPLAGKIGTIAADCAIAARDQTPSSLAAGDTATVRFGIDQLQANQFKPLDQAKVGLITNHTGVNAAGTTTSSILAAAENVDLIALFSPEHGIAGQLDQANIPDMVDPVTGVKIFSLYGKDRKPNLQSLQGIDTLVFDIQDIGTRFYTYISTMGNAMEVAEQQGLRFVVLDRPNPIGGVKVAGPMLDAGSESFVAYHALPVQHGMTVGELARMFQAERFPKLNLEVVPCAGWAREIQYDATGLYWVNPSPNMRNLNQALLYPGVGLLEYTNLSVGRGTDTPFEHIGAPWLDAGRLAKTLNGMGLPGVTFVPKKFTPSSSKFANQECQGVHILINDRSQLDAVKVGLGLAVALRRQHATDWELGPLQRLLVSSATFAAIEQNQSLEVVLQTAETGVADFLQRRAPFLIY